MSSKKLPFEKFEPAQEFIERNENELSGNHKKAVQSADHSKILDTKDMQDDPLNLDIPSAINYLNNMCGLSGYVNRDVCISPDQKKNLLNDLLFLGKKDASYTEDLKYQREVGIWLNSVRNECSHCLNAECRRRNPDFPLEKVLQESRKMDTPSG